MVKTLQTSEAVIQRNYERMTKIKQLLDNKSNYCLDNLYREVKGNSYLYIVLRDNKILISTTDGLIWNNKIPVSMKLARTITEDVKKRSSIPTKKYRAKLAKEANKSTIKSSTTKVVNKSNRKANRTITQPTTKKVSLFWGLISWDR